MNAGATSQLRSPAAHIIANFDDVAMMKIANRKRLEPVAAMIMHLGGISGDSYDTERSRQGARSPSATYPLDAARSREARSIPRS
jgi:hypothetical protein